MPFMKQQRDKLSLIGRLQSLLQPSPKLRASKVAQPGARLPKSGTDSVSRADDGFGKRKRAKR
jgi:hypothetical protein